MNKNIIFQDNAIEQMKLIPDESFDLIVTDPPYKTTSRGSAGNSGGMLQKEINRKGKVFEHNNVKISDYASEFYRTLKEGSHCYVMTNHVNLFEMLEEFKKVGFHFTKSLIWDKGNKIMGRAYMSQFEYILFFRKGKFKQINDCGTSDIISVPNKKTKGADGKNIHDTEKPVELMKILIENSTNKGDLVFDPFMGSGSTALACIESERNFFGYELDATYYKTILSRIKENISEKGFNKVSEYAKEKGYLEVGETNE